MKRYFLSQQNFIDSLFPDESLADYFGIRFRGLEEISHNEEDDGEFAGPQFYVMDTESFGYINNFPKKFPCVGRVLDDGGRFISMFVYLSDFQK